MLRLLDANLDRAREGLRVAEDWARFGLDRRDLVEGLITRLTNSGWVMVWSA